MPPALHPMTSKLPLYVPPQKPIATMSPAELCAPGGPVEMFIADMNAHFHPAVEVSSNLLLDFLIERSAAICPEGEQPVPWLLGHLMIDMAAIHRHRRVFYVLPTAAPIVPPYGHWSGLWPIESRL